MYTNTGPDNNHTLDMHNVRELSVPKGYRAEFDFTINAVWPQAACIYYKNSDNNLEEVAEKTTQSHWVTPYNDSEKDKEYIVSGWYHNSGQWTQSKYAEKPSANNQTVFGFDDGFNDKDYDDIVTSYSLERDPNKQVTS